jgi:hypothetical protein
LKLSSEGSMASHIFIQLRIQYLSDERMAAKIDSSRFVAPVRKPC